MTDPRRRRLGLIGAVVGAVLIIGGVLFAHFTNLPLHDSVGRPIYDWIPRCTFLEPNPQTCWVLPIFGQATAVLGSQILIGAIVYGWILGRPLTWAGATVAAFLFTLEMIILLGLVPNQWLNLAQGTLDWSERRILLTVPRWLVLNNTVRISYAALKDIIAAGWSTTVVIGVAVLAYQLQERAKSAGKPQPATASAYGRPVVKGGR